MQGRISILIHQGGYGFVDALDDGTRHFFHRHDLVGLTFDSLAVGQVVEGDVVPSIKGPRVSRVRAAQAGSC
jgi:cold shock CspA family protein